jgi:hypothetical protein
MPKNFKEKDKIKCLLWCNRHCCLCGKSCDIDIELAHLPGRENSTKIDDGIPVCSRCHIVIGSYNPKHPKGTRYRVEELKARREQVYEEYTRNLVPPIDYQITQYLLDGNKTTFPDVRFNIFHRGNFPPVNALVGTEIFLGEKCLKSHKDGRGHYSLDQSWHLNPGMGYQGHFELAREVVDSNERLKIKVYVTIVDPYDRHHELLPVEWVYDREKDSWWANP